MEHCICRKVRIISPWAIFLTSALNGVDGLIIHSELILYEYTYIGVLYLYKNFELKRGGGLIIHHGLIIRTIYGTVY